MDKDTESIINRLRRVEGQLRGIQRMLEDGRVCDDVVTQLMAVRNAIDQVGARVLEMHIQQCVFGGSPVDREQAEALRRALTNWARFGPAPAVGEETLPSETAAPSGPPRS